MHWDGYPFFHMGGIFMVVFWVVVALVVISLWKKMGSNRDESAEEVLKKRYARGEISKEEFERMKEDLRS